MIEKIAGKVATVDQHTDAIKQLETQFARMGGDIERRMKAVKMHSWDSRGNYRGAFESEDQARAFGAMMLSKARGVDSATDALAIRCSQILDSDYKDIQQRAMDSATDGALLVPEFSSRLHRLVEQFSAFESNAFVMPMVGDSLTFLRRTGGMSVFLVGENTAGTASQPTFGNVTLNAKEWGTLTYVPRTLADDAIAMIGELIATEIAQAMAEKMDDIGFNGDGTVTYFGVNGVRQRLATVNGVDEGGGLILGAGNAYTELTMGDHERVMGALPTYATANAKWFVSRSYFFNVMVRLMNAVGGVTAAEIEGRRNFVFGGDPVVISQKMPRTAANSQVCALYGDLRQAVTVGQRRGVNIDLSKDYKFAERQLTYLGTRRVAVNVHDVGTDTVAGPIVGLITAGS